MAAEKKIDIGKIDVSKLPPAAGKKGVTYANDIRPILEASCFRCHGEEKQKWELRLDSLEAVLKGGEDGKVVVSGDSKRSLLVLAVAQVDDEIVMPPKCRPGGPEGQSGRFRGGGENRPPGGEANPSGPGAGGPRQRPGGAGGPGGGFDPPKPLTAEQVGLIRAWVDQGAK
jgi:cytochrome c